MSAASLGLKAMFFDRSRRRNLMEDITLRRIGVTPVAIEPYDICQPSGRQSPEEILLQ